MKAFAIFFPAILSACVTANENLANNQIHLIYVNQEDRPQKDYFAVVMQFDLVNLSDKDVCVLEDIFINDLSPHVIVKPVDDRGADFGLPHPPKSSEIIHLHPGETKRFTSVVAYRQTGTALVRDYRVAVDLSFCENGAQFEADTIVHLNSPTN